MIWASTLQIQKHEHFDDFNFTILSVVILPLFVINLDDVSLFADSSFLFLAMLNLYLHLMYYIDDWNEWISIFLVKKTLEPHIQREK
jgi:Ca2+/Na+ antiporter